MVKQTLIHKMYIGMGLKTVYPEVILLDTSGLLQVWYGNSLKNPLHKATVTAFWVKPKSYIWDKENKRHSSLININDCDTDMPVHSVWKKLLSKFSVSVFVQKALIDIWIHRD